MERIHSKHTGRFMIDDCATIAIVEASSVLRDDLHRILQSAGFVVEPFGSTAEYLRAKKFGSPNCIVANADFSCPRLQGGLSVETKVPSPTPVVFVTTCGDVGKCVRLMKAGAIDYLVTPIRPRDLVAAVRLGIAHDLDNQAKTRTLNEVRGRYASLSQRETEVLRLLIEGKQAKQIAGQLHICAHTTRVHTNRVMIKMCAHSIVDLVRMTDKLDKCQANELPPRSLTLLQYSDETSDHKADFRPMASNATSPSHDSARANNYNQFR